MCMENDGKDTKHTMHISSIMHFVRNGENGLVWGLKIADIATENVGEHDWTPIMNCIMVRLFSWDRTIVQEGWQNTG